MPQTEMPINNATSTELSVDGRAGTNEKEGVRGEITKEYSLVIKSRYGLRRKKERRKKSKQANNQWMMQKIK